MKKTLTKTQFMMVKRTAQVVNPLVMKKNKLIAKLDALQKEIDDAKAVIDIHEGGVKYMTGGYTSEDLFTKILTPTDKYDKAGKVIIKTEYKPTDLLVWNEEKKVYEIGQDEPELFEPAEDVAEPEVATESDNVVE